jgi:hypothetical protein
MWLVAGFHIYSIPLFPPTHHPGKELYIIDPVSDGNFASSGGNLRRQYRQDAMKRTRLRLQRAILN